MSNLTIFPGCAVRLSPPRRGVWGEDPEESAAFERAYVGIREAEGRLWTAEGLAQLPEVPPDHPKKKEWKAREDSALRLRNWFKGKEGFCLDIGCGNGWMSNYLAGNMRLNVLGIDMNRTELEQGAAAFGDKENLAFGYADIFSDHFPPECADFIVMAASAQYFLDFRKLVHRILSLLRPGGSFHLLDTPLYPAKAIPAARKRSREYYRKMGFPELADQYHHISWESLKEFDYQLLYRPDALLNRMGRKAGISAHSPFPWLIFPKP